MSICFSCPVSWAGLARPGQTVEPDRICAWTKAVHSPKVGLVLTCGQGQGLPQKVILAPFLHRHQVPQFTTVNTLKSCEGSHQKSCPQVDNLSNHRQTTSMEGRLSPVIPPACLWMRSVTLSSPKWFTEGDYGTGDKTRSFFLSGSRYLNIIQIN